MEPLPVCNVGVFWPNRLVDQDPTLYRGIGLDSGDTVLDVDPAPPPTERGTAPSGHFSAHVYCQKVAHLSNCWALVRHIAPYCPYIRYAHRCGCRWREIAITAKSACRKSTHLLYINMLLLLLYILSDGLYSAPGNINIHILLQLGRQQLRALPDLLLDATHVRQQRDSPDRVDMIRYLACIDNRKKTC